MCKTKDSEINKTKNDGKNGKEKINDTNTIQSEWQKS